jgi:hypothetical protein
VDEKSGGQEHALRKQQRHFVLLTKGEVEEVNIIHHLEQRQCLGAGSTQGENLNLYAERICRISTR